MFYKARNNEIVDSDGRQIAVVLPTNCTKKAARQMAAYCVQQMNHTERQKQRTTDRVLPPNDQVQP